MLENIPDFMPLLFSIVFLLILSAFFSSSETALTALSRVRIDHLRKNSGKRGRIVSQLRKRKDRLIGSILIGNNVVNILASALATKFFLELSGENGVLIATIIMTVAIIIFAEILPKTYAFYHSEKVALFAAPFLLILTKLCLPFTILIQKIMKLFRISMKGKSYSLVSAIDELRGTIELHHKDGAVIKQDRDMLDSILDLPETEVESVMIHRKNLMTIDADLPNKEILELLLKSPFSRVPIWKGNKDNIIGVLHLKDVFRSAFYSTKNLNSLDITKLATEPWFITETTNLKDQLLAFRQKRAHFAIVVNEYGTVMGIITLEDILEEIVGEIKDEHDKGSSDIIIKKLKGGAYTLDGETPIRDINRKLSWELPEGEEYSTIAGLVIHYAEKIPDRGDIFKFLNIKFEIIEKHKNQITKLQMKKLKTLQ